MSDSEKKCTIAGCTEALLPIRWDCVCGCGKSWCETHGDKRKRGEFPGQVSYLRRIVDSKYRQRATEGSR